MQNGTNIQNDTSEQSDVDEQSGSICVNNVAEAGQYTLVNHLEIPENSDYNNDCFKARTDSDTKSRYGKPNYPFIYLGKCL